MDFRIWVALGIFMMAFAREGRAVSRFTLGGYVPFASSIQDDARGGVNTFSFAPALGVGTSVPLEGIGSDFSPEVGVAFHESGAGDDYKKSTLYVLGDFEMEWGGAWSLRYGLGFFATFIQGQGGKAWRKNGDGQDEFSRPSRNSMSYNLALDLGWDYRISPRWFLRMEMFVFSLWDDRARDLGYLLVLGYRPLW